MKQFSKFTTTIAAAALTAACSTTVENPDYAKCMARTPAPEPGYCAGMFPSKPARGVGGITAWIDQNMPLLIGLGIAVIVIVAWSSAAKEKAQQKQQRESAALARGRQIAQDANAELAARSPEDLRRYSTFGWAVPHLAGTAFGFLVDRDGGTARVHAAWAEACELARLGHTDEGGKFVPAATVVNVNGYGDGTGDLELSVSTADYSVGERELNRVLDHLTRTARVETASAFTRNAAKDWHITRLSMIPEQQKQQAPEPEQPAAPDPTAAWEW